MHIKDVPTSSADPYRHPGVRTQQQQTHLEPHTPHATSHTASSHHYTHLWTPSLSYPCLPAQMPCLMPTCPALQPDCFCDDSTGLHALAIQVFGDAVDDAQAAKICSFSDVIFLGVKPQFLGPVLASLSHHITPKHTLVSIAAGWTLPQLEAALPPGTAVLRVMPNTPILVGQGASVYCLGSHAGDADRHVVHELLQACGVAMEVSEANIDAATAVSGCGPAYMFQVQPPPAAPTGAGKQALPCGGPVSYMQLSEGGFQVVHPLGLWPPVLRSCHSQF